MTLAETRSRGCICPSGRCRAGANLLGIVNADGTVGYLCQIITVGKEFVQQASKLGPPEKRFRFAERCIEKGCHQWTGNACGVIAELVGTTVGESPFGAKELPACSIRAHCRWFAQHGREACLVCPLVVTNNESPLSKLPLCRPALKSTDSDSGK